MLHCIEGATAPYWDAVHDVCRAQWQTPWQKCLIFREEGSLNFAGKSTGLEGKVLEVLFTDGLRMDTSVHWQENRASVSVSLRRWESVFQAYVYAIAPWSRMEIETGRANANIDIYSDSQAINAIKGSGTTLRLVRECQMLVRGLATHGQSSFSGYLYMLGSEEMRLLINWQGRAQREQQWARSQSSVSWSNNSMLRWIRDIILQQHSHRLRELGGRPQAVTS